MARLVGLPDWHTIREEISGRESGVRVGQFVWNKYGQIGIDGEGWPEFFYADDAKALDMLANYYGYGQIDSLKFYN